MKNIEKNKFYKKQQIREYSSLFYKKNYNEDVNSTTFSTQEYHDCETKAAIFIEEIWDNNNKRIQDYNVYKLKKQLIDFFEENNVNADEQLKLIDKAQKNPVERYLEDMINLGIYPRKKTIDSLKESEIEYAESHYQDDNILKKIKETAMNIKKVRSTDYYSIWDYNMINEYIEKIYQEEILEEEKSRQQPISNNHNNTFSI